MYTDCQSYLTSYYRVETIPFGVDIFSCFCADFGIVLIAVSVVVVVVVAGALLWLSSSRQELQFDVSDVVFLIVFSCFFA